jgi:leucyl-tRNA synthetase
VSEEVEFPPFNDVYLGVPLKSEIDLKLCERYNLPSPKIQKHSGDNEAMKEEMRRQIIAKAQEMGIGGDYKVSSKLKDWLISRQRYWGTPIPIIYCENCGAVPVPEKDLPVKLPELKENVQKLSQDKNFLKCECPKCKNPHAKRETDTMDTFVDSSWYFLRYLDVNNEKDLVDKNIGNNLMPVDVYIGGKEHAVLHLYYARFMNHFLHQKGYVNNPEPFKKLLVQGMVKGKTFKLKETGQYLNANEVEIINEKKSKAKEKSTNKPVEIIWEKMSKSKFNGVDPVDVINTHGCDTMRLIMLGDVAPTSHRNWSEATFPGIINWQKRLWMTLHDLHYNRLKASEIPKTKAFNEHEEKLLDSANFFASGATFNFIHSHQVKISPFCI